MKSRQGIINLGKGCIGDCRATDKVTKVLESQDALQHFGGDITMQYQKINLENIMSPKKCQIEKNGSTFTRAFESSPIHCLKQHPCVKEVFTLPHVIHMDSSSVLKSS